MDLNRKTFKTEIAGQTLRVDISNIAEQANGSAMVTYGGTTVLATAVMTKIDKDGDFMPLTVDYEEKFYAAGKILGSQYVRREGRPSVESTLSARLIDRAIRPLFDSNLRRGIQVTNTILSYDEDNDPDFVALVASSLALSISDIPWNGPIAGITVSKVDDAIVLNPKKSLLKEKESEIVFSSFVAGNNGIINMIELEGLDADEKEIINSYKIALQEIEKIISFQKEIIASVGKSKSNVQMASHSPELTATVTEYLSDKLEAALYVQKKVERASNLESLLNNLKLYLTEKGFVEKDVARAESIMNEKLDEAVHKGVLYENRRPDGRAFDEVRPLYGEVGLLERTHGSAIFVRGNTQSLGVVTLAAPGNERVIESIEFSGKQRFMLHYNFPGYSVGEATSYRGPGRRDIGHGALAEKAVRSIIPDAETFPYTIRVVSEILSSNGSSSMATVCSATMALMDAGVPIKKPVAGIAMGLMSDPTGAYKILTDIQGPEDHHGDMDFKVAGTKDGVNAIQMDVKISGVNPEILFEGLEQAKLARLHILSVMDGVITTPRPDLSPYAPRVSIINIDPSRIGEVIGPGGKIINGIIARTGVTIDIEDSGRISVASVNKENLEAALLEIRGIVREFKIGEIIEGNVIKTLEFGAIVDLGGGRDGMIHVSELKEGFVKKVTDVVNIGDFVQAKIVKIEGDKIGLSIKQLKPKTDSSKASSPASEKALDQEFDKK